MYSFLFTLSVVLIALALSYLVFHGREHTTIGRFIIYCSVNLTTIYVIQWLLIIYGFLFMMIIGSELISLEAVICGTADRFGALDTLPHRGWVPPWRRAQLGARFVRNEEVVGSNPIWSISRGCPGIFCYAVTFYNKSNFISKVFDRTLR